MRRRIRTIARIALAALVFHAAASEAFTPSLLSRATGTVWGTNAGDEDVSLDGVPVNSAAAYTRPPEVNDGAISASAAAAFGTLGAHATLSVTNAPGYLSAQYPFYGTSKAEGYATFQDRWTFSDRPLDTPGRLRLRLAFDGAASGSATGAMPSIFGRFHLDLVSLEEFDDVHDAQFYHSGELAIADETPSIEIDFVYGRPVVVTGSLLAEVMLISNLDAGSYSGGGDAAFDQTAALVGLEVQDAQAQWTTSYTIATASGAPYPFEVPEPSQGVSADVSLAALGWCWARRRRGREASVRAGTPFAFLATESSRA